jgi:membrane dipeptidase
MSEYLESEMRAALSRGEDALRVHDHLADERARQFRDDTAHRECVREYVEATGVTAFGVTLISFGRENPQGWDGIVDGARRVQTYVDAADWLSKALTPADMRSDGVSILLQIEDTSALDGSTARLADLYDFGVRTVQLTYSSRNLVGDGCAERTDAGLSEFGLDVVERANELGMMIELSHCGRTTTMETIDVSDDPPAFSHVFCRALRDEPRGKSDEELERLAAADGYVGISAIPFFQGEDDGFAAMLNHVEHAADVVGVERVGIGTNWGIWTPEVPADLQDGMKRSLRDHVSDDPSTRPMGVGLPPMETYRDWEAIPEGLADRGYNAEERRLLCGESFVRYFKRVAT